MPVQLTNGPVYHKDDSTDIQPLDVADGVLMFVTGDMKQGEAVGRLPFHSAFSLMYVLSTGDKVSALVFSVS